MKSFFFVLLAFLLLIVPISGETVFASRDDVGSLLDRRFPVSNLNLAQELVVVDSVLQAILGLTVEEVSVESSDEDEFEDLINTPYWSSASINPYRGVTPPSNLTIDCSEGVLPIVGHICSDYGVRRGRMHTGTDLKLQLGDTVVAAFSGKVRFAKNYMGYGKVVVLRHPNGLETLYSHLSHIGVAVEQTVRAGEYVGLGGRTGRASATHLHFEVRLMGRTINPSHIFDFKAKKLRTDSYVYSPRKVSAPRNTLVASATIPASGVHVIRRGETLGLLAKRYKVSVDELCRLNDLTKTTVLQLGQKISLGAPSTGQAEQKAKAVVPGKKQ